MKSLARGALRLPSYSGSTPSSTLQHHIKTRRISCDNCIMSAADLGRRLLAASKEQNLGEVRIMDILDRSNIKAVLHS